MLAGTFRGTMLSAPRSERRIVVLAGPTGVGKTRIAIELCKRFGGEIVGADSVQVYRELDIGSNKPSRDELQGIAHHLIDLLEPSETLDAARYAALADAAIDAIAERGKTVFVAGGTGLWLRALLRGLVAVPAVDPGLRAELEHAWDADPDALYARLREVDPRVAARVHARDRVRVIRALEVHAQTGRSLGELQAAHALGQPRYAALVIALDMPLAHWQAGIAARTRDMLARGWADEVRGVVSRHGPDARALRSVGYRQLVAALREGWDDARVEREIVRATRLYAKRQRNWFRSDPSVGLREHAADALGAGVLARIERHLSGSGPSSP